MMTKIFFAFILAIIPTLVAPAIFPAAQGILFFAPFLVIVYYEKSLITSLWFALAAGLIIDLLSSETRFGLNSLNYCLTTTILYIYKRHFFEDNLTTIPIMSFFFSFLSTCLQIILLYAFGQEIIVSWKWGFTDLIFMPLFDTFYAFLWFSLPLVFLSSLFTTNYKRRSKFIRIKK